MRDKRTVVWERQEKPARYRSESAERIRSRLRPTAFTRVTDGIVDRLERIGEWIDGRSKTKELVDRDPRVEWFLLGTLALSLSIAFVFDEPVPEMMAPFFGTLGATMLALVSYGAWNRAHPLPPVHERTRRHEVGALLGGIAAGVFTFAALRVFNQTVEGGMGMSLPFTLFCSLATCFGIFMHRTGEREAQPRRTVFGFALWALSWLLAKALEIVTAVWPPWLF